MVQLSRKINIFKLKLHTMKYLLILITLIVGLGSCNMIAKEIKKNTKVRKAAKKACNCGYVGVEVDYNQGNASLTMTIRRSKSTNHLATSDSIFESVQNDFPNICNYSEVFVIFEEDEFDERFTYYSCETDAIIDTLTYEDYYDIDGGYNENVDDAKDDLDDAKDDLKDAMEALEEAKEALEEAEEIDLQD